MRPSFVTLALLLSVLIQRPCTFGQNDFWQRTNGPFGGVINAISLNASGDILAGSNSDGIYRSKDDGATWTAVNTGLTVKTIRSIALAKNGHLFAGTTGGGIFRSSDGGTSWSPVNSGLNTLYLYFSIAFGSQGEIFTSTNGLGVYRSTNNGDTWTAVNNGLTVLNDRTLGVNNAGTLFVGTSGDGVFRSTNNGDNWVAANAGMTSGGVNAFTIGQNGFLFAGTSSGMYRSTNNGDLWTSIDSGLTNKNIQALVVTAPGTIIAGTQGGGSFRSSNNGETWSPVTIGTFINTVQALAVKNGDDIFAASSAVGIFRSPDNGNTWTLVNNGIASTTVSMLAAKAQGDMFAGTNGSGAFRSTDEGATWTPVTTSLTYASMTGIVFNKSGHVFLSKNDGVFRSVNNGDAWTQVNNGFTVTRVGSLAIDSNGVLFAGFETRGTGVFRSTHNGDNWTSVKTGLPADILLTDLAVNARGDVFAGSNGRGMFRSTDKGDNWIAINTGLTETEIRAITFNAAGHVFVGTSNGTKGVFRSTDNGNSWQAVITGLTEKFVETLTVSMESGKEFLYAGTKAGVFRSTDNGDYWSPINTGLSNPNVIALATRNGNQVFAGTNGSGVFRSKNIPVTSPPLAPSLVTPANGAINLTITPTFRWDAAAGAETYRIQIATNGSFSNLALDDSIVAGTSRQAAPLANNTVYYWRVAAKNIAGASPWSEVRSFTTIIALPGEVQLLLPVSLDTVTQNSVRCVWAKAQPGVTRYWFEIATSSIFTNSFIDSTLTAADTSFVASLLVTGKYHTWRVRAGNLAGWGPFGDSRQFFVDIKTGTDDAIESPELFTLQQNYPNPFSGTTTIQYHLSTRSHVRLQVRDMLGRVIETLVDDFHANGVHTLEWTPGNIPRGMYLIVLSAGGKSTSRQMIKMR